MKRILLFMLALLIVIIPTLALCEGTESEYPVLTGETGLYKAGVYEVIIRGMGGKMTVHVTFEKDTINAIEIVKHTETPNIGTKAIEKVIPEIIEAQSTDVDIQSGATITSDAIIEAVDKAIEQALAPVDQKAIYNAGTYEVVVRGLGGKMTVDVTFTETAIDSIEVVKHTETPNIGTKAIETVIPEIIEAQSTDVDAQTGATITSDAIKEAVDKAIELALVPSNQGPIYNAGTYEVVVRGLGGKMTVDVTFTETAIENIEVVKHTETPNIGTKAIEKVIPEIIEAQSTDVDAQAGATITSDAIKEAVSKAIEQAKIAQ